MKEFQDRKYQKAKNIDDRDLILCSNQGTEVLNVTNEIWKEVGYTRDFR